MLCIALPKIPVRVKVNVPLASELGTNLMVTVAFAGLELVKLRNEGEILHV